jgi:hypothetical protein
MNANRQSENPDQPFVNPGADRRRRRLMRLSDQDPAIPTERDPLFVLELTSKMYGRRDFLYYSLDEMLAGAKDLFCRASREWEDDRLTRRISLVVGCQGE